MVATSADRPGQGMSGRAFDLMPIVLGLSALVVTFGVAFLPSIVWIFEEWSGSSGVLSHGFLIAAISVYLFVRTVPEISSIPTEPLWWALPVLLALSMTWLLGYVATVAAVQAIVLPAILITAITLTFGLTIARRFAFPVLFIYFAIPAVEHLQFIFQEITIVAVHAMIRIVDISAYVEGRFVHIPEGTFAIEGGCSGLSFVVSGLSLAALYGYLYHQNWRQIARLALLVLAVAMIGNWIRVFGIVNIGYFFGMDNKLVADHLWLGWLIFAILMFPVLLLARRRFASEPAVIVGELNRSPHRRKSSRFSLAATAASLMAMAIGPAWARIAVPSPDEAKHVLVSLPEKVDGWRGPQRTVWDWQPRFSGVTAERLAEYKKDNTTILVYANVYLSQAQGRELIYFNNSILGSWTSRTAETTGSSVIEIQNAGWFQKTVAGTAYGRWIVLHRNIIGREPVIGNIRGKIRQSLATLRGRPEAGVIAFAIPCAASCAQSTNELIEFISAVGDDATVNFEIEGE